jgi:ribulose-phosphate 3-epimerase
MSQLSHINCKILKKNRPLYQIDSMAIIAPSLLAANFLKLGEACAMLNESEAEYFHLDVMDGSFVPNISFGLPIIEQIRKATSKVCDVHLMIVQPEKYIEAFKKAGADILTIHYEACPNLLTTLAQIKAHGMKAGVAINPDTEVSVLTPFIKEIDLVCVMSVYPGFGGQKFIEPTYEKVKALKQIIVNSNATTLIEIDGGVDMNNAAALVKAGADVLVAGTTVFKAANPIAMIASLKQA